MVNVIQEIGRKDLNMVKVFTKRKMEKGLGGRKEEVRIEEVWRDNIQNAQWNQQWRMGNNVKEVYLTILC